MKKYKFERKGRRSFDAARMMDNEKTLAARRDSRKVSLREIAHATIQASAPAGPGDNQAFGGNFGDKSWNGQGRITANDPYVR
jgi:hypothetical protein